MSSGTEFIETREYRRFVEFCDSCCRYRYIGLCYGAPGVGKTLSARHYTRWDAVEHYQPFTERFSSAPQEILGSHLVFYTPKVVNSPGQIEQDIARLRGKLRDLIEEDLLHNRDVFLRDAHQREQQEIDEFLRTRNWPFEKFSGSSKSQPTVEEVVRSSIEQRRNVKDPTELIVIDEADRLKMAGLEQLRDIFDRGGLGMVFIGMPGLEKRLAAPTRNSTRASGSCTNSGRFRMRMSSNSSKIAGARGGVPCQTGWWMRKASPRSSA